MCFLEGDLKMKKFVLVGILALFVSSQPKSVFAENALTISSAQIEQITQIIPLNLINWKVGDSMDLVVSHSLLGKVGTALKIADREEGDAIWIKTTLALAGQNQIVEALMNRADGKMLKYRQNGKDQAIPDQNLEIISQDHGDVTVPAGTFKAVHIVAKSKDVSKIEIWANPQATCLDGNIKTIAATAMGDLTLELSKFTRN